MTLIRTLSSACAVAEFSQAFCKDTTLGYRVELERRAEGASEWKQDGSLYFWSYYFLRNMPEKARAEFYNLYFSTEYRGKIFALNPFFKESEKAISFEFKTGADPHPEKNANRKAEKPEPNVLNLHVVDGKVVNTPRLNEGVAAKSLEMFGAPKIVEEPDLNGAQVVEFDGKNDFYKAKFTGEELAKLGQTTIGARFKVDEFQDHSGAIISDTQGAGVALSVDGPTKTLRLWASVNWGYRILSVPIELGRYYTAYGVFDGRKLTLYLDGKEVAHMMLYGAIHHPADGPAQAFCFGSDINPKGGGESFFKGRVESAVLYDWGLNDEQIANLSK